MNLSTGRENVILIFFPEEEGEVSVDVCMVDGGCCAPVSGRVMIMRCDDGGNGHYFVYRLPAIRSQCEAAFSARLQRDDGEAWLDEEYGGEFMSGRNVCG